MGKIIEFIFDEETHLTYKLIKDMGCFFSCDIVIEEKTIFGHLFQYKICCFIGAIDNEEFIKCKMLSKNSVEGFMMDYMQQVFEPVMSDYFWTVDTRKYPTYKRPYPYKIIKKDGIGNIEMFNYYKEILEKLKQKNFFKNGCEINSVYFQDVYFKVDNNMISNEDREYIIKKFGYLNWIEKMYIAAVIDMKKKKEDIAKSIIEQSYSTAKIKLKTILLDNGLCIKWENNEDIWGYLKIYRREGEFFPNVFDNVKNGLLILDSRQKTGEMIDYLEPDKDYYYTVNYVRDEVKEKKLIGKKIIPSITSHYFRFSARLPEKSLEKPQSEIEILAEREKLKFETERIRQKYRAEREAEQLRGSFDKKRLKSKVIMEEEEKIRQEYLSGRKYEDLSPREMQEMGRDLQNLQDMGDQIFDRE